MVVIYIILFMNSLTLRAEGLAEACQQVVASKGLASAQTLSYCNSLAGQTSLSAFSITDSQCIEYAKQQGIGAEKAAIFCREGMNAAAALLDTGTTAPQRPEEIGLSENQILNPGAMKTSFFDYYYSPRYFSEPPRFSTKTIGDRTGMESFAFDSAKPLFDEKSFVNPLVKEEDRAPKEDIFLRLERSQSLDTNPMSFEKTEFPIVDF